MKRIAALGLALLAALTAIATTADAASSGERTPARRPVDFAVGKTTVQYDNQGRTVTVVVYYPAAGRATTLEVQDAPRATKFGPYPLILFSHDALATPTVYR